MDIFAFDSPGSRDAAAEPIPHTEPQQASAVGLGTADRCAPEKIETNQSTMTLFY
jgi:hypothetical protein